MGGRVLNDPQGVIIEVLLAQAFANPLLYKLEDGAVFAVDAGCMALTTDSYVVSPMFFTGGGELELEADFRSDTAPLHELTAAIFVDMLVGDPLPRIC